MDEKKNKIVSGGWSSAIEWLQQAMGSKRKVEFDSGGKEC